MKYVWAADLAFVDFSYTLSVDAVSLILNVAFSTSFLGSLRFFKLNMWRYYVFCTLIFLQRKKAVNLNVRILDLCNEFLTGTHLPNKIDKRVLPEHIQSNFTTEGNYLEVAGLHADCPNDLVSTPQVSFGMLKLC